MNNQRIAENIAKGYLKSYFSEILEGESLQMTIGEWRDELLDSDYNIDGLNTEMEIARLAVIEYRRVVKEIRARQKQFNQELRKEFAE